MVVLRRRDGHEADLALQDIDRVDPVVIGAEIGIAKGGGKVYTLYDFYQNADLITYPSVSEGFGNAILEAIYFKKPIFVSKYATYVMDIMPKGFITIEMDDYVTEEIVQKTREVIKNPSMRERMTNYNYGFRVARNK